MSSLNNLVSLYHEKKLSHAYLIETNNIDSCFLELKNIIKQIFCVNDYCENCSKCNICNLVDQQFLPSFKVIEPVGSSIKKEQVLELKRAFSLVPTYTKDNIYIIKMAEKLTDESANTMLKFIEEPEDNIIGFFITDNINNVISTICSRCEILHVNYKDEMLSLDNIKDEEILDTIVDYLKKIEVEKHDKILYNRDILLARYSTREDIKKIFKLIVMIYMELLNKSLGLENKVDMTKWEFLTFLKPNDIIFRINLINKLIDDLDYNANIELLLDKFLIELGE